MAAEAIRAEQERRAREEQLRIDTLLSNARARVEAEQIRAFVAAVEAKRDSLNLLTTEVEQWVEWARSQADRHDPLVGGKFLQRGDEAGQ